MHIIQFYSKLLFNLTFEMSTRIPRLWHPGNPRPRIFLPDYWVKLIETPRKGYKRLPKNAAAFEIDPRMSSYDVREYLEKIYKFPVRDVRTRNVKGEILWDFPLDKEKRRALWKEEDKKISYVYFKKDFCVKFPDLFENSEMTGEEKQIEKAKQHVDQNINQQNQNYINKERAGVGELLPL